MSSLPPQMMRAIDELMTREAGVVEKAYGGLADAPVAPKMVQVYKRIDELMSKSENSIACGENCSYCCHYHIYSTPLEIFTITEHIATWPEARRQHIEQALRSYVDQVKGIGRGAHIQMNIACSFLDNGRCSIYAIRPLACRRHHSRDVGICQRTFDNPTSPEPGVQDPVRMVASTAMENLHGSYQIHVGRDTDSYEFHAALLEALTNKASFKRWKSGKKAFPSVADKSSLKEAIQKSIAGA